MDAATISAMGMAFAAIITALGTMVVNWRNSTALLAKQAVMLEKQDVVKETIDEVRTQTIEVKHNTNAELTTLRGELGEARRMIQDMHAQLAQQEKTRAVLAAETRIQQTPEPERSPESRIIMGHTPPERE